MKSFFTKLFTIIALVGLTTNVFGQTITANSVTPAIPTSCTSTFVNVDVTQLCINYIYNGPSHVISGNTITVYIDWQTPGPICLGALAFLNPVENLGQLPPGNYTLNIITRLDNVPQNSVFQPLNVISCCGATAAITTPTTDLCIGESLTLTDASLGATNVTWEDSLGNTLSTTSSLTVSYSSVGSYPISLIADNGSCADTTMVTIQVDSLPTVDLGMDQTLCDGTPVVLDATVTDPNATYTWSNSSTFPTFNVVNSGTYDVTVNVGGCTVRDTAMVTFEPQPDANIAVSANSLCLGDAVTITNNSTNTITNTWTENGVVVSTNAAYTPTYTNTGTYNISLVTVNGNCIDSTATTIVVNDLDPINIGNDTTICAGESLILDATVPNPNANYNWGISNNPTLTVTSGGTYSVQVTLGACAVSDTLQVGFNIPPTIDIGDDQTLCDGATFVLNATAGNVANYVWQDGTTGPTYTVSSAGTYTVQATGTNGCVVTDSIVLDYYPPINIMDSVVIGNPGDTVTLSVGTYSAYLWSTGQQTAQISVTAGGQYSVTVTDGNGCQASMTFDVALTNTNQLMTNNIKVYPNPTTNLLTLDDTESNLTIEKVFVINVLGQVVGEHILQGSNQISVSDLPQGNYFLKLYDIDEQFIGTTQFTKF